MIKKKRKKKGGGATAAVRTPDTAIDESTKEAVASVSRFPNRFSSRNGHPWYHKILSPPGVRFSLLCFPFSPRSCFFGIFFPCLCLYFFTPPPPSLRRYLLSFVLLHSFVQQCVLVENLCFPSININSSLSDLLASFVFCFISAFF